MNASFFKVWTIGLCFLISLILTNSLQAQEFADKNFYLIDSLVLEDLNASDREILDSNLIKYHAVKTYHKLAFLDSIFIQGGSLNLFKLYHKYYLEIASIYTNKYSENSEEWNGIMVYYGSALNIYAQWYYQSSISLDTSILYYQKTLEVYKQLGMRQNIGETLNMLSLVYRSMDDQYFNAAKLGSESLNYLDSNYLNTAYCLANYSIFQMNQKNLDEAIALNWRAIKIAKKFNEKSFVITSLADIAYVQTYQNELSKADSTMNIALELLHSLEDADEYTNRIVKNRLGELRFNQGKIDTAETIYLELYELSKDSEHDQYFFCQVNNMMAKIALSKENFSKAKEYATTVYNIATTRKFSTSMITRSLESLIAVAKQERNYELAFNYLEEKNKLLENTNSDGVQKSVLKQALQFEYEKQKEIDDLKNQQQIDLATEQKEKTIIGLIAAAIIATLIALFSIFMFNRLRLIRKQKIELDSAYALLEESKKNELAVSNLKALQSQMNPHFIFNALNSVQDLVLLQDIRSSNKYLGKFSDLIRKILLSSKAQFISLGEEIEILGLYLDLEKLRFGEEFKLDFTCTVSENDQERIELPAMFIQPYIENAIKHGLFNKKGEKRLKVAFKLLNDTTLECVVEDNGIGQEAAAIMKQERLHLHTGFSTEAINERIRLLNQTLEKKIDLKIEDLMDGEKAVGTRITLLFPV